MPVRQVLRLLWNQTDHVGIEHMCAFIDSISFCSFVFSIACMHGSQFFFLQGEYDSENTTSSSSSTFCFHAVICFLLRAVAPLRFMMDYVTDKIASVSCSTIPRQHDIRQPGRLVVSAHERLSARYSLPWPDGRIAASPFQVSWAIATEYFCSPLPP